MPDPLSLVTWHRKSPQLEISRGMAASARIAACDSNCAVTLGSSQYLRVFEVDRDGVTIYLLCVTGWLLRSVIGWAEQPPRTMPATKCAYAWSRGPLRSRSR